jgi:Fe-S-cluster containining protein
MIDKLYISQSLSDLIAKMDEDGVTYTRKMLEFYSEQYKSVREQSNGNTAVASIHDLIDECMQALVKKATDYTVSCQKGCSFCCYQRVDISDDEASLLVELAKLKGFEIDYQRLEKQLAAKDEKEFQQLRPRHRKCVFLQDGDCAVYEHRPSACRKLVVVSDPKNCDTVSNRGAKVGKLADLEAEVVTAAALNVRESGSMAEMILKLR